MNDVLSNLILACGVGQLTILIASALVPFQLDWKHELKPLSKLHRQMYWVYGGYIVLSIIAFALISIFNSEELASGSGLARAFCFYVAIFWGIRVILQTVFDVQTHLTAWWLKAGYHLLTILFITFTLVYSWVAVY